MRNAPEQFSDDDLLLLDESPRFSRFIIFTLVGLFSRTLDEQQIKSTVIIIFPAQTIL
jgi:hypothetical protein